MIMDVRWLYETKRASDFSMNDASFWSTHQFIDKIVGHCGYNRKPGAKIEDGMLRVRRVDDPSLTNPNQGATWNFPTGHSGKITTTIRLEKGNQDGLQIALTDRWFNPTDPTVDQFANYVLPIDRNGRLENKTLLTPGQTHELTIHWENKSKTASLMIDGKTTGVSLPLLHPCPNGISYIHFYNPATQTDPKGFSILKTQVTIE